MLNVASASAFQTYQNLTVQSTNGAQSYFCKAHSATQFSTCTANGATGTVATGGWVSDAGPHQFDVYTVAGGKTAVTNTSLTILNDAPAAGRGIPSYTTATANNGLITYVQSANPTGTVDLTYGICRTGTATYSSTNPNCSTGVIHYGPGVSSNMGADVTVVVIVTITTHVYQTITNAMFVPATVNPGQTYKVRIAPSVAQIPKLQSSSSGDATVNNSRRFTSVFPIPAGATYVSGRLIGGDAKLQPNATLTYCTTTGTAPCIGKVTGNFDQTTLPYVIVQVPDTINTVLGGQTATMPTVELTLTGRPDERHPEQVVPGRDRQRDRRDAHREHCSHVRRVPDEPGEPHRDAAQGSATHPGHDHDQLMRRRSTRTTNRPAVTSSRRAGPRSGHGGHVTVRWVATRRSPARPARRPAVTAT